VTQAPDGAPPQGAAPQAASPEGPDAVEPHHGPAGPDRLGRRASASLVGVFVLIALGALSTMVGLPYVVLKPGPAQNTLGKLEGKDLYSISGAPTYPTTGALDFTTVRVQGGPGIRVTVWEVLRAALDPSQAVVKEDLYFPKGVTEKQVEEETTAEMVDSQQEAIAVALKETGHKVTQHVMVAQVAKDAPSAALLKAGDEITAVDGKRVTGTAVVRDGITAHKPGETVALTLLRDGRTVQVQARTRDSGGRTTVGVFLGVKFDFPVTVKFNLGDVGGPSAGTMFSLGLYDTLTPGALTGGMRIAGTGTMDFDTEQVGPIGGIQQKLYGARAAGARWFLAPASNCDEVVGHGPDGLRVVRIASFGEAKHAVEAIAAKKADGLPTCR
jgi:PDZ domain-containing protein